MSKPDTTFNKVVSKSVEFWTPIYDGLNLDSKNDPRYRLKEYLERTVSQCRTGRHDIGTLVKTQEDIYRACIACWNHWRRGEELSTTPGATSRRINPV